MLVERGEIPSPFFYHVFQIFLSFTARTIFSKIFLCFHSSPALTARTLFGKIWEWFKLEMTADTARRALKKGKTCKKLEMTEIHK